MTVVRPARPDDAPALADLFWRVRHDNAATIPLPVHPRESVLAVVQDLVALAKERRPAGLGLWVFASNTGAVRFYERHGFAVVGGTDGDNEEGAPDLRMQWRPVSAGGSPR